MYTLAVDIGGTKIATGLMNEAQNWIATDKQASDPSSEKAMFTALTNSMDAILEKANIEPNDVAQIGITIPGQVNYEEGIAIYANNLPWRNFPVKEKLQRKYPTQTIVFEHDVVAAAYGEWAIRDLTDELFLYKTVSTGICASIIYRGQVIRGTGTAGEVGLIPLDGMKSLEEIASGPAMERGVKEIDANFDLQTAFAEWEKGHYALDDFFQARAMDLAKGIYTLLSVFDAHIISLGGGVLNNQKEFFDLVMKQFQSLCTHPFQKNWSERIEHSKLEGTSGLYGVAMKARQSK